MKKILFLLILILVPFASAYTVSVDYADTSNIVLSFENLESRDLRLEGLAVQVDTASQSDTYAVDAEKKIIAEKLKVIIDTEDIFEDYTLGDIELITVRGTLDGEFFSKRIFIREEAPAPLAAPSLTSTAGITWVVAAALVLVFLVLLYLLFSKPQPRKTSTPKKRARKTKKAKKKTAKKKKRR